MPISEVEHGYTFDRICLTEEKRINLSLQFRGKKERIYVMKTFKYCIKAAELIRKQKQKNILQTDFLKPIQIRPFRKYNQRMIKQMNVIGK